MRELWLAGSAALALAYGCSSQVTVAPGSASSAGGATATVGTGTGTGTGTSVTTTSASTTVATVGSGGAPPACLPSAGPTFAADKLYLGDTDWNDQKSSTAWQLFGRDIDGMSFGKGDAGHCKLYPGASPSIAYDAPGGLDNSFGKNILPLLQQFAPQSPSATADQAIHDGDLTLLFVLEQLGMENDKSPLVVDYFGAEKLPSPPKFDGSDCWPTDPIVGNPGATFPNGALAGNQLNTKVPGTLKLALVNPMGGQRLYLTVHQAMISVVLSGDHKTGKLGILSGIVGREELVEVFHQAAGGLSPTLCSGATWDAIANNIRQNADILLDGTQDPAKECDGISIGIGFTLSASGIAAPGPAMPPPMPCK